MGFTSAGLLFFPIKQLIERHDGIKRALDFNHLIQIKSRFSAELIAHGLRANAHDRTQIVDGHSVSDSHLSNDVVIHAVPPFTPVRDCKTYYIPLFAICQALFCPFS
jgi:hypothetical protein